MINEQLKFILYNQNLSRAKFKKKNQEHQQANNKVCRRNQVKERNCQSKKIQESRKNKEMTTPELDSHTFTALDELH